MAVDESKIIMLPADPTDLYQHVHTISPQVKRSGSIGRNRPHPVAEPLSSGRRRRRMDISLAALVRQLSRSWNKCNHTRQLRGR
ncbi:unnamed protein product [Rhizoctonia solani]|uniref:Uncharacterized protein n=1 Tax=Rhizoctonia solani TaxID=456999 RepID=A0A8H3C3I2_9AGAM|nr:unnamed protein product [Rhizoctonia solani]